jgi:uncharacterized membrane protein YgcG
MSLVLRRYVLLPALLLAAALGTAGCEVSVGDKTLDAGSVEDQIKKNIEDQGGTVQAVDCPGGKEAKTGNTFDCEVTFGDGTTRTAVVELVDDKGTFNYSIVDEGSTGGGDSGAGSGAETDGGDTGGGDSGGDSGATDEGGTTG